QAETAYLHRRIDALEEASWVLRHFPSHVVREVGSYYNALALDRRGFIDEAQTLYLEATSTAPAIYQARALQSVGTQLLRRGKFEDSSRILVESIRAASSAHDFLTVTMAQLNLGALRSGCGDHIGALRILESVLPLIVGLRAAYPVCFYSYHNALAVELGELGRLDETKDALGVALGSPFAVAYP